MPSPFNPMHLLPIASAAPRIMRRAAFALPLPLLLIAGCQDGGITCPGTGGVSPERPTPRSLTLNGAAALVDVDDIVDIEATVSGGCSLDTRAVALRTVSGAGNILLSPGTGTNRFRVRALREGSVQLTAVSAADTTVRSEWSFTIRPRAVRRVDVRPGGPDTLSPRATLSAAALVLDNRDSLIPARAIFWRSLQPAVATVNDAGQVTAVANGTAAIVASTPVRPGVPGDTARDTLVLAVVDPCTRQRTLSFSPFGAQARFDGSNCRTRAGMPASDFFAASADTRSFFIVRLLNPPAGVRLVPLIADDGSPVPVATAGTGTAGYVVLRPRVAGERVGVAVVAPDTLTRGTYALQATMNPDPFGSCDLTDATRSVALEAALYPGCSNRDVRILGSATDTIRVSVSSTAFPFGVLLYDFPITDPNRVITQSGVTRGQTVTIAIPPAPRRYYIVRLSAGAAQLGSVSVRVQ